MPRLLLLLLIGLLALAVAACGDDDEDSGRLLDEPAATATEAADACDARRARAQDGRRADRRHRQARLPAVLQGRRPGQRQGLRERGRLRGRRRARASTDEVEWTVVPFNASYAPGPKEFDFDINQISITPKRAERVDFSDAVLHGAAGRRRAQDSDAASADRRWPTSRTPSSASRSAPRASTPSTEAIQPSSEPQVFNDSNDTVRALKNEQVDAIVVDLPTAFYLTAAEVARGKIVGQFDAPGGDDWGAAAREGLAADDVRRPGARGARRARASCRRSRTSGWAARPARPSCNSAAHRTTTRRRAASSAPRPRRRRARRQTAIAAVSTVLVLGLLVRRS